jgi:hypothetical protein
MLRSAIPSRTVSTFHGISSNCHLNCHRGSRLDYSPFDRRLDGCFFSCRLDCLLNWCCLNHPPPPTLPLRLPHCFDCSSTPDRRSNVTLQGLTALPPRLRFSHHFD